MYPTDHRVQTRVQRYFQLTIHKQRAARYTPAAQGIAHAGCPGERGEAPVKIGWPSLGIRPKPNLSTGSSALNGNARPSFGSIGAVQVNNVSASGSTA